MAILNDDPKEALKEILLKLQQYQQVTLYAGGMATVLELLIKRIDAIEDRLERLIERER